MWVSTSLSKLLNGLVVVVVVLCAYLALHILPRWVTSLSPYPWRFQEGTELRLQFASIDPRSKIVVLLFLKEKSD